MTRKRAASRTIARIVRCAIYTRKSTEEGLEQEYNSLDAQYDACSAYISPVSAMKAGSCSPNAMTMAASQVATWSGRGSSACWPMSTPARSM